MNYVKPTHHKPSAMGRKILRALQNLSAAGYPRHTSRDVQRYLADHMGTPLSLNAVTSALTWLRGGEYVRSVKQARYTARRTPLLWIIQEDDWATTQRELREGDHGDWDAIRVALCEEHSENYPDDGISSSDMNHMAYGAVKSGRLPELLGACPEPGCVYHAGHEERSGIPHRMAA